MPIRLTVYFAFKQFAALHTHFWILDFWIFGFLDFWISGFVDSGFVVDINVLRGKKNSKFLLPKKLSTKIRLQEVVRLN